MKTLVEVREVANEGLEALLGQNVEVWCTSYIYAGKLVGVNERCIKLANPFLVYETGAFSDKKYKDAQSMNREAQYIMMGQIESFGLSSKL